MGTPKILFLIRKNIKTMFRDKAQLAWIIGYPLIFIAVFGIAFGGASDQPKYDIVIFNNDEYTYYDFAEILVDTLEGEDLEDSITVLDDYDDYDDAYEDLRYGKFDAIILIDDEFSDSIWNNESAKVKVIARADQVVEGIIGSIIRDIVNDISMERNGVKRADIDTKQATDAVNLEAIDYMAPGFIIAGTMVIINQIASHMAEEKQKKTLERLATTPVSRRDIVLSAMLSELVVAAFQTILMLILASQVFGAYIHPNANLFLLFSVPMLFAFTCVGIGLILASLVKSEGGTGFVWLIILPLQFLGNIFSYGVDVPLSEYNPTTYAVNLMRLVMTNGISSWDAIGFDIIVLICTGIGFTLAGLILFQRKTAISK